MSHTLALTSFRNGMNHNRVENTTRVVSILFLMFGLYLLSGCSTSKQGYVAKGNKLFEAGKYPDAVLNYRKAIQKDEHFGEAFYRLGLVEIKRQNSREAFDALYRAVQLMPNNMDAKEQLGGLSLEYYLIDPHRPQFYYNTVKQTSNELLANNPKSYEGLREKAYLAMSDGRRDEAIGLFRTALEGRPSDAIVATALVQNLALTDRNQEAEKLGLDLIAHQKDYGPIYNMMYELYMKENRPAEAEGMLKARVANNSKDAGGFLSLASYYARAQRPAEMQNALQHLLDAPKDFPQARMLVGDFYFRLRNFPEAVRYYEDGTRNSQGDEKVLYQKRATNALLAVGKSTQASSTVDQIVQENPKDKEARRVQANLMLRSGNSQKIDAAEHELKDLSTDQPNDASVWLGLGRAEELRGNLDVARSRYLEALNKNPNYLQARYALAEIGLVQKRPEETLQQAGEILKVRPDDQRARLLRAQALARTGNSATARVELTRIKDFEHNPQAQVELGLLALSEKKYQEAEQIFGRLRESGEPQAIAGLAKAYTAQKQFDKAIAVLNDGLKRNNSALLLSQLGSTEAVAGRYDAAIATLQKLAASRPTSAQDRLQLADVYSLQGDAKNALAAYREAAQLAPADADTGLELARALSRAGQVEEARAQYQAVLKAHPDDALALNDMAFFIWENGGNLDQALGFAQQALARVPGQPSYSDTIGCIYLKKGLNDSALQVFNNLVKKYPNYTTFRYHLGMALLEKGDKKNAKKELETALAGHPSRQDEARIKELLGKIS